MGNKTHPSALRLNTMGYRSDWFASGQRYRDLVVQDLEIRKFFDKRFERGLILKLKISRSGSKIRCSFESDKVKTIIGKGGAELAKLKIDLKKKFGPDIDVDPQQIFRPDCHAEFVAVNLALQIQERPQEYKRVVKKAMKYAMRSGIRGIAVRVNGKLGGSMARSNTFRNGSISLMCQRRSVDYSSQVIFSKSGTSGVRVFISHGGLNG